MKKNILALFIVSLVFTGCDNFLDKTDPTATSFDQFYNDEEDLRRVCYSSYVDVFASALRQMTFWNQEGKSDNAYSRVESDYHQSVANGNLNSNTTAVQYYYKLHMKHLGRLNVFIDNVDLPYVEDEAVRAKYKGVLESLRVWHYFILTSRWGDVPFLLHQANLEDALQPVTPKEEILDSLFVIVERVKNELPQEQYETNKYMFNGLSLRSLAMRYALYNGRYELAIKYAREIIDAGYYELYPNYGDLFQYAACSNNKEFIMHQDKDANSSRYSFRDLAPQFRTGGGQSYCVPLKALVDSYWTLQGNSIDECPLHSKEEYELNPKLNRDPRYSVSIMGHGDLFYGEELDIYNTNALTYYTNTRASRSGYWFRKFVSDNDAFNSGGSTTLEYANLRYAEVLLSLAEAKIMLNEIDDEVKSCINQIRTRAGLDMSEADVTLPKYSSYTQEQWIKLIRNERRIELAGEGQRYDDIIRWKIADTVLNEPAEGHTRLVDGKIETLKIEDRKFDASCNYLWPFHESCLNVEPNLVQNPGY
ncbi:MAG: RagB/SusD family nutrient uptake outer membrane protein [Massilibacteroides sp.]|nr:RagB/SusD family nutrient uptake outer membrane protein [Massilibacteroides sp.]MDD3061253.1 RagB/SusD family nutrient uptake outer membrane protein [Massilibacteroides sp.]MDD4115446.1 RagB/SusD family nutrient uptake outer membrane protein [Massilibacteroides sp.]MDD4659752.1 RagB/SusD family nutrient uptake outer membrane protein [Massilibacteroides sp.]